MILLIRISTTSYPYVSRELTKLSFNAFTPEPIAPQRPMTSSLERRSSIRFWRSFDELEFDFVGEGTVLKIFFAEDLFIVNNLKL
ncbi:Uncharacterised protein [Vibrio cholerae]|nr:Uncharacterised protein [Vibrio cholerae]CSA31775.1 Uncharacterised protein [Vibrio cholerae]CSA65458.1 Uncharacterised protein [Vibrio cholerae]CSB33043.1 Uncharacterised protein [Vibrio cholerae]CSC43495.1 Uncharacterised protein [Vibrio cholerae]